DGTISAFFADIGQEVYEGQLIARVTNESFETAQQATARAVEAAQARLNSLESAVLASRLEASRARAEASRARGDYDRLERTQRRQEMLYREGAAPKLAAERAAREYELAQSEYRGLEGVATRSEDRVNQILRDMDAAKRALDEKNAELEDIKTRLGASELLSPAQGIVVGRKGDPGAEVTVDRKDFFQIAVDLNLLEVVLEPEPPVLNLLKAGQAALIVVADQPGDGILGSLRALEKSQAIIAFTSPNPAIKPGQTAQVRIKLK
ncbi:MAG: hypothetical protein HYR60_23090, partial [Acidobacteria bacterium]|nr:hypothetical protein [Acidobacteriota bacterium]